MLAGVLLFINLNLQKKTKTQTNQTEAFAHPVKVRVERREKAMVLQDPGGKEEAVLCPCALPLLRKAERGGGERKGDLRHRWHNIADNQQNGPLEEGGGIK